MDRRQINRHAMHADVLQHFDAHRDAWSAHEAVAEEVDALRAAYEETDRLAQRRHDTATPGATATKDAREAALIAATVALAGPLRAFARKSGDPDLLHRADLSASDLRSVADEEAIRHATSVLDAAEAHAAGAARYGVTPARIADLREALDAFHGAGARRGAGAAEGEAATAALPALFARAREALDVLDDVVPALVEDAAFVAAYRHARRVDDR